MSVIGVPKINTIIDGPSPEHAQLPPHICNGHIETAFEFLKSNPRGCPVWIKSLFGMNLHDHIHRVFDQAVAAERARFQERKLGIEQYTTLNAQRGFNAKRNRYNDVMPYDSNRVLLETKLMPDESDYINASCKPNRLNLSFRLGSSIWKEIYCYTVSILF